MEHVHVCCMCVRVRVRACCMCVQGLPSCNHAQSSLTGDLRTVPSHPVSSCLCSGAVLV